MWHVGGYETCVSEDPKVLSSHFLACWALLYLLGPAVALKWDAWKEGADVTCQCYKQFRLLGRTALLYGFTVMS